MILTVYQGRHGPYYATWKDRDTDFREEERRTNIGDRLVVKFANVNDAFWGHVLDYLGTVSKETRLTAEEFTLERIIGVQALLKAPPR